MSGSNNEPPSSTPDGPAQRPRCSPFDDLPAELLLMLYEQLGFEQFMDLALAIYPTLLRHGMAPALTPRSIIRISSRGEPPAAGNSNWRSAVANMPAELWLQVAEYIEPADRIALVLALGWRLSRRPSRELVTALRIWSRRSRNP